jgi:hypothetical protein
VTSAGARWVLALAEWQRAPEVAEAEVVRNEGRLAEARELVREALPAA